jgi:hypothetical protein
MWLVVSPIRWLELEKVLGVASAQAYPLSRRDVARDPLPLELPFEAGSVLGLPRGKAGISLEKATGHGADRAYLHALEGGVSVLAWKLRVLPAKVLVPFVAGPIEGAANP